MADDPIRNEDGSPAGRWYGDTEYGLIDIRKILSTPERRWLEMDCEKLCSDVQRYFDARYEAELK